MIALLVASVNVETHTVGLKVESSDEQYINPQVVMTLTLSHRESEELKWFSDRIGKYITFADIADER